MIAPDKLTAYSDYLSDKRYADLSKINDILVDGLHAPRLDRRIKDEITAGVVDLYLPNDTHWGVNGHKLAADVMIEYLKEGKLLNSTAGM